MIAFYLQVGAISGSTSIRPVLLKNIGDASVSFLAWLCIGYALASGEDTGGILGTRFFSFTGKKFAAVFVRYVAFP